MIVLPTEKRFDWKHAPVMLFSIAIINILVFFLYQSADQSKYINALESYEHNNLLRTEWPAYQHFLDSLDERELLNELNQQFNNERYSSIVEYIVGDEAFYQYILNNEELLYFDPYKTNDDFQNWRRKRNEVDDYFYSISTFQGGLIPEQLSASTLISYQFLHGDFYHLLGNLFFLIFCGFAVEAALGAWLFLGLYLASGITGGLLSIPCWIWTVTSLWLVHQVRFLVLWPCIWEFSDYARLSAFIGFSFLLATSARPLCWCFLST